MYRLCPLQMTDINTKEKERQRRLVQVHATSSFDGQSRHQEVWYGGFLQCNSGYPQKKKARKKKSVQETPTAGLQDTHDRKDVAREREMP